MKTMVVYATKSGCTTGIAERIASALEGVGADVDVFQATDAGSPAGYDAVVVGSGVRAGTWHGPAREWVSTHADILRQMPVAFFTCGLMITQDGKVEEVRGYTDPLIEETGIEPVDIGLFAGWNEPKAFSFPERTVMKLMKAPIGDFRDYESVERWAGTVARELESVR